MADMGVKMGVSGLAQFKQAMSQAQASVKTYDAEMKLAEKQLKATGDAEQYMQTKTTALKGKLQEQQRAVASAEQALKTMKANGVDPASVAFQNMQQKMLQAQAAVLDTQADIQELGTETVDAAGKTDKLADSLGGLNRKVSLDQVISAMNKITDGIAGATRKAVELGKALWENITDVARYSDDIATQAMVLGMSVEDFQRYKGVFDTVGELTVQEWMKAKQKVQQAIHDPTADQQNILSLLGISTHAMVLGKTGIVEGAAKPFEEIFWEIGKTLREKVASGELTQDLADTYAQAIFGKGFSQLNPIFALGEEGFAAALEEQTVASEEAVNANAELNDKLIQLEASFQALKMEVTGELAPALTAAADSINGLLQKVMEWLQTPEGQQALEDLGTAVEGLFSDLGKIDPDKVAEGFAKVFHGIVDSVQWLMDNWGGVKTAIEGIGAAFLAMKVGSGVLTVIKLIDGLKGLTGGEGQKLAQIASDAAGAGGGTSTAAAAGGGFLVGIQNWITQAAASAGSFLGGLGSTTLGVIGDWFTHNTHVGRAVTGSETWDEVGKAWNDKVDEIKKNAESFGEDWAGVFQNIQEWAAGLLTPKEQEQLNPEGKTAEDYLSALEAFGKGVEGLLDNIDNPAFEALYNEMPQDLSDKLEAYYNQLRDGLTTPLDLASNEDFVRTMDEYFAQLKASGMEPQMPAIINPDFGQLAQDLNNANMHIPVSVDLIFPRLPSFGGTPQHANGLPYVPFDGYMAVLHKGERVVPAREAERSYRSFSSNLYVESMYMNNGQDAEGLAASIAAANRRTMAGFGS